MWDGLFGLADFEDESLAASIKLMLGIEWPYSSVVAPVDGSVYISEGRTGWIRRRWMGRGTARRKVATEAFAES